MPIFLEIRRKLIHDCKVDGPTGAGLTKCNFQFLIGDSFYKPDAAFEEAVSQDDGTWIKCRTCGDQEDGTRIKKSFQRWRRVMSETLKKLGWTPFSLRPEVDWPNAAGGWWCDALPEGGPVLAVPFLWREGAVVEWCVGYAYTYHKEEFLKEFAKGDTGEPIRFMPQERSPYRPTSAPDVTDHFLKEHNYQP